MSNLNCSLSFQESVTAFSISMFQFFMSLNSIEVIISYGIEGLKRFPRWSLGSYERIMFTGSPARVIVFYKID